MHANIAAVSVEINNDAPGVCTMMLFGRQMPLMPHDQ